jgi:hypothetical protein
MQKRTQTIMASSWDQGDQDTIAINWEAELCFAPYQLKTKRYDVPVWGSNVSTYTLE